MKTIPLRTLLREPQKVKRMTREGMAVQVTDKGKPLWLLRAADQTKSDDTARRQQIDEVLDDVLLEAPSKMSAVKLLEWSRR
jgi:hypothetical protein